MGYVPKRTRRVIWKKGLWNKYYRQIHLRDFQVAEELLNWYKKRAGNKMLWRSKTGRVIKALVKAERHWKDRPRGDGKKGWAMAKGKIEAARERARALRAKYREAEDMKYIEAFEKARAELKREVQEGSLVL